MKGWWKSNMNVWFRFMYSQKLNWKASFFTKQNYNVLSPNFTFIYSQDRSAYFSADKGRPILGIYKSLTNSVHECRNWERGRAVSFLGIHKLDFRYSALKIKWLSRLWMVKYYRVPKTDMSWPWFEPTTSCSASDHSSKELFEHVDNFLLELVWTYCCSCQP
jgi:hypothetical protein